MWLSVALRSLHPSQGISSDKHAWAQISGSGALASSKSQACRRRNGLVILRTPSCCENVHLAHLPQVEAWRGTIQSSNPSRGGSAVFQRSVVPRKSGKVGRKRHSRQSTGSVPTIGRESRSSNASNQLTRKNSWRRRGVERRRVWRRISFENQWVSRKDQDTKFKRADR